MAKTAQRPAHVPGQRPDISAFAAFGLEYGAVRVGQFDQREPVDIDRPCAEFDRRAWLIANVQVANVAAFEALLAKVDKSRPVSVLVRRGSWVNYLLIRPR